MNHTIFRDEYVQRFGIRDDTHGMRMIFNRAYEEVYNDAVPLDQLPRYVYSILAPMCRDDVPVESLLCFVEMIMERFTPERRVYIPRMDMEEQMHHNSIPRSERIPVPAIF